MKSRIALVAGVAIGMVAAWTLTPARLTGLAAAPAPQHEQHQAASAGAPPDTAAKPGAGEHRNMMMDNMMAADARLDTLVKTMNEAKGAAKVDAVAAVVNALVEQHKAMHGHMSKMGGMMNKPAAAGGGTQAPPEK